VDQATGQQTIAWSKVSGVRGPISSIASSPVQAGLTVAGALTGFWMSTDAGSTWHESNAGRRAHRFLNVVPAPANPAIVFGLAYSFLLNEEQWVQVFRSIDFGETWTLSLETPILGRPYLAIDERPPGTGTVYLNGRLASTDLGQTWTTDVPFDGPEPASSLYIDPGNNDLQAASVVFVKFPSGVVPLFGYLTRVTTDGWRQDRRELKDLASSLMRTDPHSPGALYLLGPAGIYRWDGHAERPSLVDEAFPEDLEPDRFIPGRLYSVSGRKLYVYPTFDSQPQLSSLPAQLGVLTVRSHVTRPGVVAAGTTDGLYLSRDSGITWDRVEVRNAALGQVSAIFFDLSDPSVLYLGTSQGAFRVQLGTASERRLRESRPREGAHSYIEGEKGTVQRLVP